jgi:hypothetical protein
MALILPEKGCGESSWQRNGHRQTGVGDGGSGRQDQTRLSIPGSRRRWIGSGAMGSSSSGSGTAASGGTKKQTRRTKSKTQSPKQNAQHEVRTAPAVRRCGRAGSSVPSVSPWLGWAGRCGGGSSGQAVPIAWPGAAESRPTGQCATFCEGMTARWNRRKGGIRGGLRERSRSGTRGRKRHAAFAVVRLFLARSL